MGAVGLPVDREAFARVGDFHDFGVEVEACGAREVDVFVSTSDFEKPMVPYGLKKSAVGFVVVGNLVG